MKTNALWTAGIDLGLLANLKFDKNSDRYYQLYYHYVFIEA